MNTHRIRHAPHRATRALTLLAAAAPVMLAAQTAWATPAFGAKEKKNCNYCHLASGKNPRNFRGIYYKLHNFTLATFDNEAEALKAGVKPDAVGDAAAPTNTEYPHNKVHANLNFTFKSIKGDPINMSRYQGKVLLGVNTASASPVAAGQFKALSDLMTTYKAKGLEIIAFPCNDQQKEPLDAPALWAKYGTMPFLISNLTVLRGEATWAHWKAWAAPDSIREEFTKFIIGRNGQIEGRFGRDVDPSSPAFVAAIEKALAAK